MTPDQFTALATGFGPSVQTKAIFDTVQYRVGGKAFATSGWPAPGWAVVKLAPSRQAWALSLSDGVAAEPGRRRKAGIVLLRLAAVDQAVAAAILGAAWSYAHGTVSPRERAGTSSPAVGQAAA